MHSKPARDGSLRECRWYPFWRHPYGQALCEFRWICNHAIFCEVCGKVLLFTLGTDCPDYGPEPERYRHPYSQRLA